MPLIKEEYFFALALKKQKAKINKSKKNKQFLKNQKLVFFESANIFLTKKEFFILEERITTELDQQIFLIKEDNNKLKNEIKFLEEDIKNLQAQKNESNWQLIFLNIVTFGIFKYFRTKKINQQIAKLEKENSKLQIKINENKKSKQYFKNQKLIFFKNANIFLKNLLSDRTVTADSAFITDEDSNTTVTAAVIMNNQDSNDTRVITAAGFSDTTITNSIVADAEDSDSDIEVIPYEDSDIEVISDEEEDSNSTDSAFITDEDSNTTVTAAVIMNNQDSNDTRVITAAGFSDTTITNSIVADAEDSDSDIEVIPYEDSDIEVISDEEEDSNSTDSAFITDEDSNTTVTAAVIMNNQDSNDTRVITTAEDSDIEKLSINSPISFSANVIDENNNLCRISIL